MIFSSAKIDIIFEIKKICTFFEIFFWGTQLIVQWVGDCGCIHSGMQKRNITISSTERCIPYGMRFNVL